MGVWDPHHRCPDIEHTITLENIIATTILTKSQLMERVISGHERECFSHSTEGIFDITGMRQLIKSGKIEGELRTVDLDQVIPFIEQNRVVDMQRVHDLDRASWRDDPGIFIVLKEDTDGNGPTVLMVDGHHRAMRRRQEGFPTIWMWFIKEENAVRPAPGWVQNTSVDWGDEIIDGKIVKRGSS